ncbi:unnamed protein product, partial [Musa acuminata subsp. burmannicoides]
LPISKTSVAQVPSAPTLKPQANTCADISIFVSPISHQQNCPLLPYAAAFLLMSAAEEEEEDKRRKKCVGNSGSVEGWKLTVITAAYSRKGNIAAAKRQRYCFVVCREPLPLHHKIWDP